MTRPHDADVVVVGDGPAGAASVRAVVDAGLHVIRVAPAFAEVWPRRYGAWADDLDRLGLADVTSHRWRQVVARGDAWRNVRRCYSLIDNARLRTALAADVTSVVDQVVTVVASASGPEIHLVSGARLRARWLVDATGASGALGGQKWLAGAARQRAYGITARFERSPAPAGCCVFMDWSPAIADGDGTFLYAFDLGDGTWFTEETSLASRMPIAMAELQRRLKARLGRMGCGGMDVVDEEFVDFPLPSGHPPHLVGGVRIGLAGGHLHPATGYSVAASLAAARRLPAALTGSTAADPSIAPPRVTRALHRYGLETLLRMDAPRLRGFFDAFFSLDERAWATFLDVMAPPVATAKVMAHVFRRADGPTRRALVSGAWG